MKSSRARTLRLDLADLRGLIRQILDIMWRGLLSDIVFTAHYVLPGRHAVSFILHHHKSTLSHPSH